MVGDGTCLENKRGESPWGFDPLILLNRLGRVPERLIGLLC